MEQSQTDLTWRDKYGVSGAELKWLAIVTMLVDHFGAAVFIIYTSHVKNPIGGIPYADTLYVIMRGIGRTAFPIFCFLLIEGFVHTKHLTRYIARMFVFCLLSEIPFDLAIRGKWLDMYAQNVYWTLLIGLLAMAVLDLVDKKHQRSLLEALPGTGQEEIGNGGREDINHREQDSKNRKKSSWTNLVFCTLLKVLVSAFFMVIALGLQTDYDYKGVALILILYYLRHDRLLQIVTGYICMLWEAWCFPGFLMLLLYDGRRGRQPKYFFYLFYPCHLILLYLLRLYLRK